jgi:hypothetical protein
LAQTVATVAGAAYNIAFSLNVNKCGKQTRAGYVAVNGVSESFIGTSTTKVINYPFTATGAESTIYIGSHETGSCGPVVFGINMVETAPPPPVCVPSNLIVNGDFSTSPGVKTTSQLNTAWNTSSDASQIAPWTFTSASNNYEIDPVGMYSAVPAVSMDLNADAPNALVTIGQSIATTVGSTYSVSFSLNQNPNCGGVKTGFVSAGSTASQAFSIADTVTQTINYSFVATEASTLIQIGSTTQGSTCGPVVYGISAAVVC